ncbi:MAG: HdeD family acid-resistance protein [Phototrophicaceae bacterium]|jgi:uncharacterized membrane protein HdeD (DUF308 family)
MANVLKQAWWSLLLRGIAAIVFALVLIFAPGLTLATGIFSFAVLFGVYALVDGVATAVGAITRREGQWFLMLLLGIIGVIAGATALGNPFLFGAVTITLMIYIFAFKAIAGGIVEMISAWQLRQEIDNEWMLALNGLFSVLFGLILFRRPITGLEVLILITSFYLLISGVMQIILAFKVRGWSGQLSAVKAT